MPLLALPAVFMRGGTSRAVMFRAQDLPDRAEWDPIFLAAMGSPDPNGRQLNGMGGGISSLSKVCIMARSERDDADVDYTFAQVQIREAAVDYRANCGNMSSAVGPFAIDEAILRPNGDTAVVRIFNTNTQRIIRSTFPLEDGRAAVDGELAIPGVAGTGAPVRLDFLAPGGATTGRLLPTGAVSDRMDAAGDRRDRPVDGGCGQRLRVRARPRPGAARQRTAGRAGTQRGGSGEAAGDPAGGVGGDGHRGATTRRRERSMPCRSSASSRRRWRPPRWPARRSPRIRWT